MATFNYVIGNETAPKFRADLNNALLAIVSNNSNATAPTVTYANMMWYDTAANILYMRNEDNDAWIALGTLDQTADTFAAAVALASQAEAETGTDNTKVMTPLRVAQSIAVNTAGGYTDAQARAAQAGHALGGVGSYAFLRHGSTGYAAGSTVAGSSLSYTNAGGDFGGGTPSGTWRLMGVTTNDGATTLSSVWLRIS
jgi:hypothetical protein